MTINELKTKKEDTFSSIECELLEAKKIKGSGRVEYVSDNQFKLICNINNELRVIPFSIKDVNIAKIIANRIYKKHYNICSFDTVGKEENKTFFLHITFFYSVLTDNICNIVLSEKVKQSLVEKKKIRDMPGYEMFIAANFQIKTESNYVFAFTNGFYENESVAEDVLSLISDGRNINDSEDEFDESTTLQSNLKKLKGLKIYGRDYNLCISIKSDSNGDYFSADAVDYYNREIPSLSLWCSEIFFKDERNYISERIKQEINSKPGYLQLWEEYSSLEGEVLLNKARTIGNFTVSNVVEYDDSREKSGSTKYRRLKPIGLSTEGFEVLKEGDVLINTMELPLYLLNPNLSWSEYQLYKNNGDSLKDKNHEKIKNQSVKIIKKIDDYFLIDDNGTAELYSGKFVYSIEGDEAQINRRAVSRDLIVNADCPMPALGILIEGKLPNGFNKSISLPKLEPITEFVNNKLFSKNSPTLVQRKAIDIALNTPDFAIIQGPPGTGKTTVIRAIIERLNEESDKTQNNTGEILVTSFQHAAVLNLRERLSVNSFPTPKFGTKDTENEEDSFSYIVSKWCLEYSKKLKDQNPELQDTNEIMELKRLHSNYIATPSSKNLNSFIDFVRKCNNFTEINETLDEISNRNLNTIANSNSDLLPYIRRIRTDKQAFADDGARNADTLYALLEPILNINNPKNYEILKILDEAATTEDEVVTSDLLEKLKEIKLYLLGKCIPHPQYIATSSNELINKVYLETLKQLKTPKSEISGILSGLLNELDSNSDQIFDVISKYNYVFSATCQQCDGREITAAKRYYSAHMSYDTVIVDEAARVNPGDLMIPMAKARNRIILVGDHRQLPHIYDEELAEKLMETNTNFEQKYINSNIQKSMFEYLMEKAKELTSIDNIQRVITLDYQFRMHPLLGNFVNENFYKNHNIEESFKSPTGDMIKNYTQNLFNKPLYWANIPLSKGPEEKNGTTRTREIEVNYIIKKIEEYIIKEIEKDKVYKEKLNIQIEQFIKGNYEEKYNIGLTYGIITFYSGQKKLLKGALDTLIKKYSKINNEESALIHQKLQRVKIGSVDEFQGMEFDVIFLSIVRSHKFLEYDDEIDDKVKGIRNYGFLTSENRLCVALSRQKKLLIIVGDTEPFIGKEWISLAQKCVPAMVELYNLCEKEQVIINE